MGHIGRVSSRVSGSAEMTKASTGGMWAGVRHRCKAHEDHGSRRISLHGGSPIPDNQIICESGAATEFLRGKDGTESVRGRNSRWKKVCVFCMRRIHQGAVAALERKLFVAEVFPPTVQPAQGIMRTHPSLSATVDTI
jgi:hypothetical protein